MISSYFNIDDFVKPVKYFIDDFLYPMDTNRNIKATIQYKLVEFQMRDSITGLFNPKENGKLYQLSS